MFLLPDSVSVLVMAVVVLLLLVSVLDSVRGSHLQYVEYGSDLMLDVNTSTVSKDLFYWKFNTTDNVLRLTSGTELRIFDYYNGRVDFFKQNYSLLLRNVRHNDSGKYKAIVSDSKDKTVAEYSIKVQDRVSPVKLTLNSTDPGSCNFTAECKTVDSQISATFQCQHTTCHLLHQTDLKESILNIYIRNSFVTCNHSNHVSLQMEVKDFASLCKNETVTNKATIVGISAGSAAAVGLIIFVFFRICKRKGSENTVYEVPQENPQQNPYEISAEMSSSPTTTYALVQFTNSPVQCNDTSTCLNMQPETIYAQVNRAGKSNRKPATDNR